MNSRRQFLKVGAAGAVGLVLGGLSEKSGTVIAQEMGTLVEERNLFADAGMVGEFNTNLNQIVAPTWWDITSETKFLVSDLPSSVTINFQEVMQWIDRNVSNNENGCLQPISPYVGMNVVDKLMGIEIAGGYNMTGIANSALSAIQSGQQIDLSINLEYPSSYDQMSEPLIVDPYNPWNTSMREIPMADTYDSFATTSSYDALVISPDNANALAFRKAITFAGWKLQLRGPDYHSLGRCVSVPVSHFNVEIFRQNWRGRWDYVLNAHIGTYISGGRRCFVMWENTWTGVCWRTCLPTWREVFYMLKWLLILAAAVVGVGLIAWLAVPVVAGAGATALYPLLLTI